MALLTIEGLSAGYDGRAVIEGLDFAVNEGDYLCIVGENGAGKTTLMKTILHLQEPISGKIIYSGVRPDEIGYLPQQTVVQKDFPASVMEIVLSGRLGKCGRRPFYSREDKEIALANIRRMGIENLKSRSYRELSGGQQQRVLLARALSAADKILLLDEPVAGLDPAATEEMYRIITELNKSGMTIIMISHDMSAAMKYASHILRIGNDIFFGAKEEFVLSSQGDGFIMKGGCSDGR